MQKKTISRVTESEELDLNRLAVYSVEKDKSGRIKKVIAYINMKTGELIPAEQLNIPCLDLRAKLPAKARVLEALRPEVREFAHFVLRFANHRRGITPSIGTLCHWYAEMHSRRSQDIRRYISVLTKSGVLAGETLLAPLFQRTGGTRKDHLGEEFRAECIFDRLRGRSRTMELTSMLAGNPEVVAAEVATLGKVCATRFEVC